MFHDTFHLLWILISLVSCSQIFVAAIRAHTTPNEVLALQITSGAKVDSARRKFHSITYFTGFEEAVNGTKPCIYQRGTGKKIVNPMLYCDKAWWINKAGTPYHCSYDPPNCAAWTTKNMVRQSVRISNTALNFLKCDANQDTLEYDGSGNLKLPLDLALRSVASGVSSPCIWNERFWAKLKDVLNKPIQLVKSTDNVLHGVSVQDLFGCAENCVAESKTMPMSGFGKFVHVDFNDLMRANGAEVEPCDGPCWVLPNWQMKVDGVPVWRGNIKVSDVSRWLKLRAWIGQPRGMMMGMAVVSSVKDQTKSDEALRRLALNHFINSDEDREPQSQREEDMVAWLGSQEKGILWSIAEIRILQFKKSLDRYAIGWKDEDSLPTPPCVFAPSEELLFPFNETLDLKSIVNPAPEADHESADLAVRHPENDTSVISPKTWVCAGGEEWTPDASFEGFHKTGPFFPDSKLNIEFDMELNIALAGGRMDTVYRVTVTNQLVTGGAGRVIQKPKQAWEEYPLTCEYPAGHVACKQRYAQCERSKRRNFQFTQRDRPTQHDCFIMCEKCRHCWADHLQTTREWCGTKQAQLNW